MRLACEGPTVDIALALAMPGSPGSGHASWASSTSALGGLGGYWLDTAWVGGESG